MPDHPPQGPPLPATLGLCIGDHYGEFYMPDAKDGDACPVCPEAIAVYVPRSLAVELAEALQEARLVYPPGADIRKLLAALSKAKDAGLLGPNDA